MNFKLTQERPHNTLKDYIKVTLSSSPKCSFTIIMKKKAWTKMKKHHEQQKNITTKISK